MNRVVPIFFLISGCVMITLVADNGIDLLMVAYGCVAIGASSFTLGNP
jgi:hypothetical protein